MSEKLQQRENQFLTDVLEEVARARAKFPEQESRLTGLALGEETGEAIRALLHIWEGKSGEGPLYLECVQTAAMALRLAMESTGRTEWKGNVAAARRADLEEINAAVREDRPAKFTRRID